MALIMDLSTVRNVKICCSSRPATLFLDAFQAAKGLRLQDLTHNDIKKYVESRLMENMRIHKLGHHKFSRGIVDPIVERADGVFL